MSPRSPELVTILSALLSDSMSHEQRKVVLRDHEELLRDEATDGVLAVLYIGEPVGSAAGHYLERFRLFLDYFRNDGYRGERQSIEQQAFPAFAGSGKDSTEREERDIAGDVCLTLLTTSSPSIRRRVVAAFPDIVLDGPVISTFAEMRDKAENDYTRRVYTELVDSLAAARAGGLDAAFPVTARTALAMGPLVDRGPAYITRSEARELALSEYLHAPTWDRRYTVIAQNHEMLVAPEACEMIAEAERRHAAGTQQAKWLAVGRQRLEACLEHGTDKAFSTELPPTFTPIVRDPFQYFKDRGHTDLTSPRDQSFQVEVLRQHMMSIDRELAPGYWGVMNIYLVDLLAQFPSLEHGSLFGEEAIIYGHNAVETFDRHIDPARQCEARILLARAYVMRTRGDRPENIRRAIKAAREAMDTAVEQGRIAHVAGSAATLAEAYLARPDGHRYENVRTAYAYCQEALKVPRSEAGTAAWARANMYLGAAVLNLGQQPDERVRREGIRASKHAIAALDGRPNSGLLLSARLNLALLYGMGHARAQHAGYVLSLHHAFKALDTASREEMPLDWATAQLLLGVTYLGYGRLDRTKLTAAYEHFQAAADTFGDNYPYYQMTALGLLADVRFEEERWDECSELLSTHIEMGAFMESMTINTVGMLAQIEQTTATYEKHAYCLYQLGKLDEALQRLENGKARLRMDRPPQLTESYQTPPLVDIPWQDLADAGVLVLPLITGHGGVVFVVTWDDGVPVLSHVPLPGFASHVSAMMFFGSKLRPGWFPAYAGWLRDRSNSTEWLMTLIGTCRLMWALLMGPVHAHLTGLGIRPGAHVVVLPGQWLSLLPLAAAGFIAGRTPKYFTDDYTVSFAPTLRALASSRKRAQTQNAPRKLLALVDPTGDLPGTQQEWAEITGVAPAATALHGTEATVSALRAELARGCGYLHLACHARFNWKQPQESGLLLANGELLTPAVIEHLPLTSVRLVTLSACETGIVESQRTPNEFIGLANAFLTAGTSAVVSSLWSIADTDTVPLMAAFYQSLFHDHLPPAEALRAAQAHVRSLPDWSHPYYWAGFICAGS